MKYNQNHKKENNGDFVITIMITKMAAIIKLILLLSQKKVPTNQSSNQNSVKIIALIAKIYRNFLQLLLQLQLQLFISLNFN